MAGSTYRDLVVRIVGDAKGMTSATKQAETGLKSFENRLGGVRSALAGAFAGGAILAFAKVSIQAALEDTRAQERLAKTLKNVVGANDEGVKAVERSIATMEKQFAVADDQLRPAFETLVRATKDVGQAQSLMQLALDVSAGSGKGLQEVTVALVKAMGGQMRGLKELGINVKTAAGDTADFADVQAQLVALFGGQAAAAADSQTGKLKALGIQYENLKESVGTALLPVLMQLASIANSLFGWFNALDEGTQHLIAQVVVFGTVAIGAVKAFTAIKAAVIAMDIAMAASPWGIAVAGIAAVAAAYAWFTGRSKDASASSDEVAQAVKDLGMAASDTSVILAALYPLNAGGSTMTEAQYQTIVKALNGMGLEADATAQLLANLMDPTANMTDGMEQFGPEAMKAAKNLQVLFLAAEDAKPAIENTNKSIYESTEALKQAGAPTEAQTRKLAEMGREQKQAGIEAERMAKRITEAATKIRETFDNTHNLTQATKDYKDALKDLAPKLKDAKGNAVDQTIAYQETVDTMLTLAETAANTLGASLDEAGKHNILIQTLSNIRAGVSDPVMQAMLDALIGKLQVLSGLTFNSAFNPGDIKMRWDEKKKRWVPGRAAGGPVSAGGTYVVGERGPELLTMGSSGGVITPNHALGGGGNTFVVNVAAPDGKDPYAFGQAIVKAIKAFERTNGKVFQAA
jgi:hypothetical protein